MWRAFWTFWSLAQIKEGIRLYSCIKSATYSHPITDIYVFEWFFSCNDPKFKSLNFQYKKNHPRLIFLMHEMHTQATRNLCKSDKKLSTYPAPLELIRDWEQENINGILCKYITTLVPFWFHWVRGKLMRTPRFQYVHFLYFI